MANGLFDNFWDITLAGEVYSSLIVMLIIIILSIVVGILSRRRDPLKKPTGFMNVVEFGVSYFDKFAKDMFGPAFKDMGGFIMGIAVYLFLSFIFGLLGLPAPMTYMAIPLSSVSACLISWLFSLLYKEKVTLDNGVACD